MRSATQHQIRLGDRVIEYRVVRSKVARKLGVRVGPDGVEVVQPASRRREEVPAFLPANELWVVDQLHCVDRLHQLRRTAHRAVGEILFKGEPVRVRIQTTTSRATGNAIRLQDGEIVVSRRPTRAAEGYERPRSGLSSMAR